MSEEGRFLRDASLYQRAIDDPRTAEAVRRLRWRGLRAVFFGVIGLVLFVLVVGVLGDENGDVPGVLAPLPFIFIVGGGLGVGFGLGGLVNTSVAKRALATGPWRVHEAKFRRVPFNNGAPALMLDRDLSSDAYYLSGTRFRSGEWAEFDGPVLVAGARKAKVVALPERNIVRIFRPTIRRRLRERTREYAATSEPTRTVRPWWQIWA